MVCYCTHTPQKTRCMVWKFTLLLLVLLVKRTSLCIWPNPIEPRTHTSEINWHTVSLFHDVQQKTTLYPFIIRCLGKQKTCTQQNSYSICHLLGIVTTQWLPLWQCSDCSRVPATVTTEQWLHGKQTLLTIHHHGPMQKSVNEASCRQLQSYFIRRYYWIFIAQSLCRNQGSTDTWFCSLPLVPLVGVQSQHSDYMGNFAVYLWYKKSFSGHQLQQKLLNTGTHPSFSINLLTLFLLGCGVPLWCTTSPFWCSLFGRASSFWCFRLFWCYFVRFFLLSWVFRHQWLSTTSLWLLGWKTYRKGYTFSSVEVL